jgi:hypothetical protein
MQRQNKTQRRKAAPTLPNEVVGPFAGDTIVKATEDSLDAFFAAESERNFQQPWHLLDKGSRLDRLRRFVQQYPSLSLAERASLLTAVLQAYELRQLNSKFAVDYDHTTATVNAIKGLRERTNAAGLKTFRIEAITSATRQTQRSKKSAPQESNAGVGGSGSGSGSNSQSLIGATNGTTSGNEGTITDKSK